MIRSLWSFSLSALSARSLQQFVTSSPGFPTLALVSTVVSTGEFGLVSRDSLCLLVCPSNLGGHSLPYVLLSFMNPRRVVEFFSVHSAFNLSLG